jgi:hypothetical protein
MRKISTIFVVFCTAFTLSACDTQAEQDEFADRASLPPSGYTQTTIDGEIVSVDEDDWRTAPIYGAAVVVDPAYPNPFSEGFVYVPVYVRFSDSVRGGLVLRAYNNSGRLITLGSLPEAYQQGSYAFNFSPGLIGRKGLVRLFIFDASSELVSYGDLFIE